MTVFRHHGFLLILILSVFASLVSGSDIYTTCDFDLENIELILPHLSQKCINLYNDRQNQPSLYQLHTEEAKEFGIFVQKLDKYERRESAELQLTEYPFDAELREQIYTEIDLGLCVTTANDTAEHYLQCVKQKRLQLIDLIPNTSTV